MKNITSFIYLQFHETSKEIERLLTKNQVIIYMKNITSFM